MSKTNQRVGNYSVSWLLVYIVIQSILKSVYHFLKCWQDCPCAYNSILDKVNNAKREVMLNFKQ